MKRVLWSSLIGVWTILLASGCSDSRTEETWPEGDAGTGVKLVRLPDGTKCAVMDKRGKGGVALDCNWEMAYDSYGYGEEEGT